MKTLSILNRRRLPSRQRLQTKIRTAITSRTEREPSHQQIGKQFFGHGNGVDTGQQEAAFALGLSKKQTMLDIILPQTMKAVLPPIVNEAITLVKDTSLAFAISYIELFTETQMIAASETSMLPYLAAAIFYYVFNLVVAGLMSLLEKKLNYYKI